MADFVEDPKPVVPAWLVSFGDMMTLILTFFILLVSMSSQREYGLVASGLGSFVAALESHGLPGFLSDARRLEIHNEFRRRFNLPPEESLERREVHEQASEVEQLRATLAEGLRPHHELFQPQVALFEPDSAELQPAARGYLEQLADTLRPGRGQLLVLEGHADDAGSRFAGDDAWLACQRARAVEAFLVGELGFAAVRVEARGWMHERDAGGAGTRRVDARLMTPAREGR